MTPKEIAAAIESLKGDELSKMSHSDLYLARGYVPAEYQNKISPYEHRAFAREATQENSWMALPIATGTVAYQPYKSSGSRFCSPIACCLVCSIVL